MWKWSKLSWPIIYIAIFPICEQQSISLTFFKFLTRGPETRFNFEIFSGKKDLLFLRRIFLEGEVSLRKVVRACRYRSNPAPRFVAMVPVSRYCVDSSFFGCHSNTKRRINQPEMRRPKKNIFLLVEGYPRNIHTLLGKYYFISILFILFFRNGLIQKFVNRIPLSTLYESDIFKSWNI